LISGRLNGAEMARSGFQRKSSFINFQSRYYALAEAHTTYGRMGIKVWIMKGEVYGKRSFSTWEWTRKQSGGKGGDSPRGNLTLIKVENQTQKKVFKLKKNVTA
jgi:small subunit ribosomal protein S3